MKFNDALDEFSHMSDVILSDGKVDIDEARMLQEFIRPYVESGNKRFVEFDKLIDQCIADGKITDEESRKLVEMIQRILFFLKIDNFVCIGALTLFFGFLATMVVIGVLR